jgi:fluoroacetyl-CoA thioesterase
MLLRIALAMNPELVPGLRFSTTQIIDASRVIEFMGEGSGVYATSRIISDIEWACRCFLTGYLAEGEDSVGIRACFEHRATGIPGSSVTIEGVVTEVEGRRVRFDASVSDGLDVLMQGSHDRFVVNNAQVLQRILAKRQRLQQAGAITG